MAERPNAHDSKSCDGGESSVGSNPTLCAKGKIAVKNCDFALFAFPRTFKMALFFGFFGYKNGYSIQKCIDDGIDLSLFLPHFFEFLLFREVSSQEGAFVK